MANEIAKRKVVVRKSNGKFASETVCKRVGDRHGTSTDAGYIDRKKIQNHGELMSHNRVIHVHECVVCGIKFEGVATAKFCSNTCRQRAKRAKASAKIATEKNKATAAKDTVTIPDVQK